MKMCWKMRGTDNTEEFGVKCSLGRARPHVVFLKELIEQTGKGSNIRVPIQSYFSCLLHTHRRAHARSDAQTHAHTHAHAEVDEQTAGWTDGRADGQMGGYMPARMHCTPMLA